jgi:hypothetical protein
MNGRVITEAGGQVVTEVVTECRLSAATEGHENGCLTS